MEVDEKACPKCAETIKAAAVVCRFCGYDLQTGSMPSAPTPMKPEPIKQIQAIAGGIIILVILVAALSMCSKTPVAAPDASATPTEQASQAAADAPPEKPAPNYADQKKDIYYYTTAVSENDQKNGQAAGDVLGFRYLGRNDDGDYVLQNARVGVLATCSDPCRVIHLTTGQTFAYEPTSVIGAAMSDAINGYLEVSPRAKHR